MALRSTRVVASGLFACVILAAACSSSQEATPPRTLTPAPTDSDAAAADDDDASCVTEPQTLEDFYNACTEGQCAPFDNVARLPLYEPGKPLPPVP